MSDKLLESISALMDNEADDLELRRLLKEMESNGALGSTWSRYHVARAVIHKELSAHPMVTTDLTSRVRSALHEEQHHKQHAFTEFLPRTAAVAAVVMISVLLTAKLAVNQSPGVSINNAVVASMPNAVNPSIQRAGYIVGQPAFSPLLRAQQRPQYNDIQRVEQTKIHHGYILLPVTDIQQADPAK